MPHFQDRPDGYVLGIEYIHILVHFQVMMTMMMMTMMMMMMMIYIGYQDAFEEGFCRRMDGVCR